MVYLLDIVLRRLKSLNIGNSQATCNWQPVTSNQQPVTSNLKLLFCLFAFSACNSPYTPKPTGYFKINFPERKYQVFNQPGYPYTFEYPVYANVEKDSSFFGTNTENPWWININFPQFNGKINVTYKLIGPNKLEKLLNDAFNMTNKHSSKADYIGDSLLETPNGVHGMFFKVEGNVATANQFFLTDSTKNFLRGALYFDATPNQDSLKPVNDFLLQDMMHLVNTFKWVPQHTAPISPPSPKGGF